MLVEVQINAARFERLDGAKQVNQRAAEPINRPGHDHIEPPPLDVLEHFIKARPRFPALRTGNAGVVILVHHFPAAALDNLAKPE